MTSLLKLGKVNFPKPADININMMPFIIGDKNSIPQKYQQYYTLIEQCQVDPSEYGKVGYLSISESIVAPGTSQRRPGIHTEKPGRLKNIECHLGRKQPDWGRGRIVEDKIIGGIFMASNVTDSCRAWNTHVDETGHQGSCEHLKDVLKNEHEVRFKENELFWLTDSCPHESLPLNNETYRQWFRFVTSEVSLWYSKHSTPNELGISPNCEIIEQPKFEICV